MTENQTQAFKTNWTPAKIKSLRTTHNLTQQNLALLMKAPQQRICEWEKGKHSMKRLYSMLLDDLEGKLTTIQAQAGKNKDKYKRLVLEIFGVELQFVHKEIK